MNSNSMVECFSRAKNSEICETSMASSVQTNAICLQKACITRLISGRVVVALALIAAITFFFFAWCLSMRQRQAFST